MVKRIWTALDGALIFEITISRDPSESRPSVVEITCTSSPLCKPQLVTVQGLRPTPFNVRFTSGCYASGHFQQKSGLNINGVDNTGIFADMHFGINGLYDRTHFEGMMVVCPSRRGHEPVWPPPPDEPTDSEIPALRDPTEPGSPIPIVSSEPGELFTYVYVRRWPRVSEEALAYAFIEYRESSPPASGFYQDLVVASSVGRRPAEALALAFIDGAPPYAGVFVSSMGELSGPVRDFATLADRVRRSPSGSERRLAQLEPLLTELFARYDDAPAYLESASYRAELDRIWQSYFALVVILGYDESLLIDLVETLWLAHLIQRSLTTNAEGELVVSELSPEQLVELANATIILPREVFPLPPAEGGQASASRAGERGWIEPYAIGDLQMVRQRLRRYAAGEIARVENVMRGERRESSRRQTHRQVELREQRGDEEQVVENEDGDERSSLLEETLRTLGERSQTNEYNDFNANYGPPTQGTFNGSWTRTETALKPELEDITRFAREVLNKTVSRISRRVGVVRTSSTMSQVEEVASSVIDNSTGDTNLRAVFRWLDKVYEAYVVNYGNRLMMEFFVRHPATRTIAQEAALAGRWMVRPPPPPELGIFSFEDIDRSNYARLCARYGVTELEPPPLTEKFVTATLSAGQHQLIVVPAGYRTVEASVSVVTTPPGQAPPQVMVGLQTFDANGAQASLKPYGDDSTLPVSVAGVEPSLSPPSELQAQVNVEVRCEPSARTMDEWRIATYGAVIKAYHAQAERYFDTAGVDERVAPRSPLANRQLEQRELKDACMGLLLERAMALTGVGAPGPSTPSSAPRGPDTSSPPAYVVDEPRYLQFLDQALEWSEMAYHFHVSPRLVRDPHGRAATTAEDDPLFTSFLQAEQARVLVPVSPDRVMAFLYFFSAGMIWDSGDRRVPALDDEVALINDLKHRALEGEVERRVGPSWEIVVPTSMQILDEDAAVLPRLAAPLEDL
ncbi:hypothetical protein G6O69_24405 [Pseudenhygromyxa sp. WMMC2535]|nr:hypothetical protein [Pseudenhygromyxa sp. WMMC2535]